MAHFSALSLGDAPQHGSDHRTTFPESYMAAADPMAAMEAAVTKMKEERDALAKERKEFEEQQASVAAANEARAEELLELQKKITGPDGGYVKLNVGGVIMQTTFSTLREAGELNPVRNIGNEGWLKLEDASFFVDRNPALFGAIIDFLRSKKTYVRVPDGFAKEDLLAEAEYWQLETLVQQLVKPKRRGGGGGGAAAAADAADSDDEAKPFGTGNLQKFTQKQLDEYVRMSANRLLPYRDFSGLLFSGDWQKAVLFFCHFKKSYMPHIDLSHANLKGANLQGANLQGANLKHADLSGADLTGAHLTGADLEGAVLTGANLTGAKLTGAKLTSANLARAILTGANLTGATLLLANLTGATLTGANLTDASLAGAILTGANLTGAKLDGVKNLTKAQRDSAIWK